MCVHVYVRVRMCTYVYVCVRVCTHVYVNMCMCVCLCVATILTCSAKRRWGGFVVKVFDKVECTLGVGRDAGSHFPDGALSRNCAPITRNRV